MGYKRFAFIRKNAKVVIPILIVIIFVFSFINHNQAQSLEGLSSMNMNNDLKKDSNIIAQLEDLENGE
jgi:hypothetical protein